MRILVFDWLSGGHHGFYVEQYATALSRSQEVVAAVPEEVAADLNSAVFDVDSFAPAGQADLGTYAARKAELSELHRSIDRAGPDHVLHLFADSLLPALVTSRLDVRVSILLFRPRAHYRDLYDEPMSLAERGRGWVYEAALQAWRHKRQAHAVLTLDPDAARIWAGRSGARAFFAPEPPVPAPRPKPSEPTSDCAVFGLLADRKGLAFIARALTIDSTPINLSIGGPVHEPYRTTLENEVKAMRDAGVHVELSLGQHSEAEKLELLAAARCVLIPYVGHYGMSRLLLEAAYVGTPVVSHDRGLVGKLVRENRLGLTVDCQNPRLLRAAILDLVGDSAGKDRHAEALRTFADAHSQERFLAHVSAPYIGEAGA